MTSLKEDGNFTMTKEHLQGFRPLFRDNIMLGELVDAPTWHGREALLRYHDLQPPQRHLVDAVLRGSQPLSKMPKLKSRLVRIFICSTPTDMVEEKKTLTTNVVPLLRAYCREIHRVDFQVVDMHWSVPLHAEDDHFTTDLCLGEINSCQEHSLGPNFLVFLGQRYGQKCLPLSIPMAHYEPIRRALKSLNKDVELLDTWYLKDSNSQPGVYVLQPISSILISDKEQKNWHDIEQQLDSMLLEGAEMCVRNEQMAKEVLETLKSSVTELEIKEGILNLSNSEPERNCICFIRDIVDVDSFLDTRNVAMFVELVENTLDISQKKRQALEILKQEKVASVLNENNIYREEVKWEDPAGIDSEKHSEYLARLREYFYAKIRDMIISNVAQQEDGSHDALYREVVQQWNLCKERCDEFIGREPLLSRIKDYLSQATDKPLVLYGDSGNGKTSLVAKAASLVGEWLGDGVKNIRPVVVLRFCGSSPETSTIRQLLRGLCHQMAYATDKFRAEIPEDYKDIKRYFVDLVYKGESSGLVVIFLDGLDQLLPDDNAHKLDWLPPKISNNVKIIVSTRQDDDRILSRLRGKITDPQFHVEVGMLEARNCHDIIYYRLTAAKKVLAFHQWKLVKRVFNHCSSPLFTKLIFEEVLQWKSYTPVHEDSLAHCVTDCIHRLFAHLEQQHGRIMVSHCLGYITASGSGLSESELEDLLSLDDKVLNAVFVYWEPPIRRIPIYIWMRIKHAINAYLVEQEVDETDVVFWYHREFINVVKTRYLNSEEQVRHIHGVMAEYYLGTWSGMKKKPFTYEPCLMKRLNRNSSKGSAVRYVPDQPMVYNKFNTNTQGRYNLRKLNHVPYHLAMAGLHEQLNERVFFNYEWLYTKLRACSAQQVISDFNLVDEVEVNLVGEALRMAESALSLDPNVLGPELTGRLLPHARNMVNVQRLIFECDNAAGRTCPIVPCWQVYTTPGAPLQYLCEVESNGEKQTDVSIIETEDRLLMVAKPFHGTHMKVWDVNQGESKQELRVPSGSEVYPTLNGTFVNLVKDNKCLQTFRVESGELYGEVAFGRGNIGCVAVGNRYVALCYIEAPGPVVFDILAKRLIQKMSFHVNIVALSSDDRYLVCNTGNSLTVHEFPLLERKCLVHCKDIPSKIILARHSIRFFVMFRNKEIKVVEVNPINKKTKVSGVVNDLEMRDFVLSENQALLLVRASRCLYVFNAATLKLKYRLVEMPPGVYVEQLSTFVAADFTLDDTLVVGCRLTYVGVWEAQTGIPVRLLQSTVSPVQKMFTSPLVNKVITLLEDRSVQVWNMENLDAEVFHSNCFVKGYVRCLAVTCRGGRIVCCGSGTAEAKVVNTTTGITEWNLVHNEETGTYIRQVLITSRGRYAITRWDNQDIPPEEEPWNEIYEDKLWNLSTGEHVLTVTRGHYIALDPEDRKIVWFQCLTYSTCDWLATRYGIVVFDYDAQATFDIAMPRGHLVGKPVITSGGRYLAFILQKCHRTFNASLSIESVNHEVMLCLYSFKSQWRGLKTMSLQDIWSGFTSRTIFLDLASMFDDTLLITYGLRQPFFDITGNGLPDRSGDCQKGALVYNIGTDSLLKRYYQFLTPSSSVESLLISRTTSMIMDDRLRLFDVVTERPPEDASYIAKMAANGLVRFLLDGQYYVMISYNMQEILLVRRGQKGTLGRCFIHGVATTLEVAEDDRTFVVGCTDGRILLFVVVVGSAVPVVEIVSKLPSRENMKDLYQSDVRQNVMCQASIERDVQHINNYNLELKQLSAKTRREHEILDKKQSSFRAVVDAVSLTREYHKAQGSRACCIQ